MNDAIESVMKDIAGYGHCLKSLDWNLEDRSFLQDKLDEANQKLTVLMANDENVYQVKDVSAYIDFEAAAKLVADEDYPPDLWDTIAGMSVLDGIKYIWRTCGLRLNASKDLYHFLADRNKAVNS